jgi:cytochrome P450
MTAGQKSKVQRINRAATARVNEIFREYGIRRSAQPEMRKLMAASGELQSAARQERNELAKVFTPTQLQEYDAIMRQVEDRIVRAAK